MSAMLRVWSRPSITHGPQIQSSGDPPPTVHFPTFMGLTAMMSPQKKETGIRRQETEKAQNITF
jgi:hypothetical protein